MGILLLLPPILLSNRVDARLPVAREATDDGGCGSWIVEEWVQLVRPGLSAAQCGVGLQDGAVLRGVPGQHHEAGWSGSGGAGRGVASGRG